MTLLVFIIVYIIFVVSKIERKVLNQTQEAKIAEVVSETENEEEVAITITESEGVIEK